MSTTFNTFVIERTYPAAPQRVFAAFSDPAKKRRWFIEGDAHDVLGFTMDFRVGGVETASYRMNANSPFPGVEYGYEGNFLDIADGERIAYASAMSFAGNRISATLATIEIQTDGDGGTRLVLTHQGAFFPGADGPEMRQQGWNSLLDKLQSALTD